MKCLILVITVLATFGCGQEEQRQQKFADEFLDREWTVKKVETVSDGGIFGGTDTTVILESDRLERKTIRPCGDSQKGLLVGDHVRFERNPTPPTLGITTCSLTAKIVQ